MSQPLMIVRLPPRRNWNVPDVLYVNCDARDMEILYHICGAELPVHGEFPDPQNAAARRSHSLCAAEKRGKTREQAAAPAGNMGSTAVCFK